MNSEFFLQALTAFGFGGALGALALVGSVILARLLSRWMP